MRYHSLMLVVLGGLLGSGRRVLARKLAEQQHFHLYDMDAKYPHRHVFDETGRAKEVTVRLHTDEARLSLYKRVLEDMPKLSKMHPNIVLEDPFTRAKPRDAFFNAARKHFDRVVFVWIDSDEPNVTKRLELMRRKGLIQSIQTALERRKMVAAGLERLDPSTRVFKCMLADDVETKALWTLINSEI